MDLGAVAVKGYSAFFQNSSITGASPTGCSVLYPENWFWGGGSYPAAEMQSVHSTVPANWAYQFVFMSAFNSAMKF